MSARSFVVVFALLSPSACSLSPLHAATTGAAFLKLGDGSRPLALGGAYVAMPGDVDSLYYNPGALAFQKNPEASFTHSEWLESTSLDLLSYAHPTDYGTFGVSALRLGGGTFEGRDINRQTTGDFSADDIACLFSFSHRVGSYVGLGANAKYLRSRIDTESASSVALDGGVQAKIPGRPIAVGASVLNVGSGLRFIDQVDRLPLTLLLGGALRLTPSPLPGGEGARRAGEAILTADFAHLPYDQTSELRMGGEYSLSVFSFRIGYIQELEGPDTSLSAAEHLRGGLGIHWSRYRADYTLAPFGDLGLTQRFTIGITFGDIPGGDHNLQNIRP